MGVAWLTEREIYKHNLISQSQYYCKNKKQIARGEGVNIWVAHQSPLFSYYPFSIHKTLFSSNFSGIITSPSLGDSSCVNMCPWRTTSVFQDVFMISTCVNMFSCKTTPVPSRIMSFSNHFQLSSQNSDLTFHALFKQLQLSSRNSYLTFHVTIQ